MRQPLLADDVERERETGRDPGAGAEGIRPRAARRLRQRTGRRLLRDVEEPQQRLAAPGPACSAAAPGRRCRRTGSGRTTPFERISRSSVAAMRAYVSDEMLAETSRTTTPLDDAGSSDPVSAGCRNELTRKRPRPRSRRAASASRSRRTRAARRSNAAASPSGIEVDDTARPVRRRLARHGRRASSHREARARGATTRRRRQSRASSGSPTTRDARLAARRRSPASRAADSRRSLTARSALIGVDDAAPIDPRPAQRGREHGCADARRPTPRSARSAAAIPGEMR